MQDTLSDTLKETNKLLKILVEDKSSGRPWTQEQLTYLADNIDLNNLQTIRRITDELNDKFDCGRTPFAVACRIIDILTNKEDCLSENRMLISKKEVRNLHSRINYLETALALSPDVEETPRPKKVLKDKDDKRPLMDRIYDDTAGVPF